MRVLFILFGAAVGGGLIIYIILWIIIPQEPDELGMDEILDSEPETETEEEEEEAGPEE